MCTNVLLTYHDFIAKSKQLDRSLYKLEPCAQTIMRDIKRQLNIKDFNDLKHHERCASKMVKPQSSLSDLYKLLNKITERTFDKLSAQILDILDKELQENDNEDSNQINNSEMVCNKFFQVICNNGVCSHLYAKLFSLITIKHHSFKTLFRVHVNIYLDHFKEIKYVSPNDDYDAYCDYVKENDKMNNFTLFLAQCYKVSICELDDIVQILLYFQNRMIQSIHSEECLNENEQVLNSIYLILNDIIYASVLHEEWETVLQNHTTLKQSSGKGKSVKMKFKMMDIQDLIDKNT
tara:strand:+ start:117 stop:992 length:876 start_codon:yes stop_codon:yes gene_type:complete